MFGELMRKHRRRLGLTQEELAARAGLNVRTIGKLETGRIAVPRPATLRLLADVFGLTGAAREAFCATQSISDDVAPPVSPAQLPADIAAFAGRADCLARLDELLDPSRAGSAMIVSGTAGVGKTALALHWAHLARHHFPHGQLYVNLRGFDPSGRPSDPADVLHGFLEALGVAPERIPLDLDARAALYRSVLAARKVLVLLDNARDAAQVRPLLPGAAGCAAVITSRDRLIGLVSEGCVPVGLDLLSPTESRALLARRLGPQRLDAEPEAVARILARCAGLPLALVIVAARAAMNPRFPLSATADELGDTHNALEALGGRDSATDLRTVFSWSYATLSPDAARLFRLLGLHGGPDLAPPAAASLLGLPLPRARHALGELTDAHLLAEPTAHRYWTHDLLRDYAAALASTVDTEADREAALRRLFDHYLHSSRSAAVTLHPHRDAIDLDAPDPTITINTPHDVGPALEWFAHEHRTLVGAVDLAAAKGFARHAWQLAWTLEIFLSRSGHWQDWVATQGIALTIMERLDDRAGQARAHRSIGTAYIRMHRHDDAYAALERAADLFAHLRDDLGLAHTHYHLGRLCEVMGRHAPMLDHSRTAHELYQAAGHIYGQARALNLIGWQHTLSGSHQQALAYCEEALALHIKLDDRRAQADTWDSLGYANHHLGEHAQAIACYESALAIYREFDARYSVAKTLTRLGDSQSAIGQLDAARAGWVGAAAIFTELGHPDLEQVNDRLNRSSG